jgi:spore germination protein GerM
MGPGHASDELRLPPPPSPFGEGMEELTPFPDRAFTRQVVERSADSSRRTLDAALTRVQVAPDKLERMKAVINREAQMLSLLGKVQADTDEVIERMKQEYKANGSY